MRISKRKLAFVPIAFVVLGSLLGACNFNCWEELPAVIHKYWGQGKNGDFVCSVLETKVNRKVWNSGEWPGQLGGTHQSLDGPQVPRWIHQWNICGGPCVANRSNYGDYELIHCTAWHGPYNAGEQVDTVQKGACFNP